MVGGLKIIRVKQEHIAEFETLFRELRAVMHEAEPGCLLYSLLKSRSKVNPKGPPKVIEIVPIIFPSCLAARTV